MKRSSFKLILLFLSGLTLSYGQSIKVNPTGVPESTMTAVDLTVDVLIDGGACSSISNFQLKENPSAQYPSPNRSWGYFEKGTSNFPFERGIVLTTGYAKDAEGPNTGTVSKGGYEWTGDSQANVLSGSTTNNATVFEFDFVPFGDHISFNYIFASEEYPTFACSSFNDVFGFVISGPGITNDPGLNGKNIALLPNGQPVTINNVNDQYCGNSTYYVAGPFPYIEYGGRTTVLTAESAVVPGQTYHIRLLIADATDTAWDSAVFLEAGSFNLGSSLSDVYGVGLGDDKSVCGEAFTIVANVEAPGATFQWYKDGVLIPGATSQVYTATENGYYSVVIMSTSCQTEVGVNVEFHDPPEAEPYEVYQCSSSGSYTFDLSNYNNSISTSDGATFSYYNTYLGALNALPGDLINNFQNFVVTAGTTVVYVRVETGQDCFEVVELTLEVGVGPDTIPTEYNLCDDDGDGIAVFDLTSQGPLMVVSDPDGLVYEYYLDASTTQLINDPQNFTNTTNPQIIYVKIYDPVQGNEGCLSVETLTLKVNEFPALQPDEITICDNLNDNSEFIDLTQNNIVITTGIPVNIQYYQNIGGAEITNPTQYEVTTSPLTIYVLVSNTDGSCENYQTYTINFNAAPDVQNATLHECSDNDHAQFHLSDANSDLVADTTNLNFLYYPTYADALTGGVANQLPTDYTASAQTVFVRIENQDGCFNIAELLLEVSNGPGHLPFTYDVCDSDGDETAEFDLTLIAPQLLTGSGANIVFKYYLDAGLTNEINNPTTFQNTTNPQIIYVSMFDSTDPNQCLSTEELTLEVNKFPYLQPNTLTICDNLNDQSEFVNLTQNTIVVTPGIPVNLHYYETIGGPEIQNPANYEVTNPSTIIHVLVRNTNGTCEDYQTITINFMNAPDATDDIVVIENCSLNEFSTFYLPDLNEQMVANTNGLTFSYYTTMNDAMNGTNPLPNTYQNTTANQIIFVRVQNSNGCYDIGRAQLSAVMKHEQLPNVLSVCDDPYHESDGIANFDLTQLHQDIETILGGTNYTIQYFTDINNAVAGINPIQHPEDFQNTTNPQTIYAQAISAQGGCAGVVDFNIEVLPVPTFELPEFIAFCKNDPEKTYSFENDFETYTWFDPNGNFVGSLPTIDFETEGIYTLEVTSVGFSCPARREIEVIFDVPPIITGIDVNGNTVIVNIAGGIAPYQFSYNNGLSWSSSGIFNDFPEGLYEMIVMSKYGCISDAKSFGVLGIPNFISPNGDGVNDVWSVRGLEAYPNARVKIFDRYGKLFVDRKLNTGFVWDGKYNGAPVASGDYWYIITLEDGQKISGHISVRNR